MLFLGPFSGMILAEADTGTAPHVTLERRRRGEQVVIVPSFLVMTARGPRRYQGTACNEGPPGGPPYVTWDVALKWARGFAAEHDARLVLVDEVGT